jgi:hypothetical protein
VTSVAGYGNTCQSGAFNAPCDVVVSKERQYGEDCDPNLNCTAAHLCKLITLQACQEDSECGQRYHNGVLNLKCLPGDIYTLSCPGGAAYCCD